MNMITDRVYPMPLPDIVDREVLVWGGLGFLGQHLIARLLDLGARISVVCRSRTNYRAPEWSQRVTWFELDRDRSPDAVLSAAVSRSEIIYNFAGSSGAAASNREPLRSLRENCEVQLAFLAACQRSGHRPHVIFPSSWLVYQSGAQHPIDESYRIGPLSVYAAHKFCIEQYLRIFGAQQHITWTICRISNPYGFDPTKPGSSYKILNWFIQLALEHKPIVIFGDGSQLRDYIYIDDVIDALIRGMLPQAKNEIFNISSGSSHSLLRAVEIVDQLAGPIHVSFQNWPDEYHAVEAGDYMADIAHAKKSLSFQPEFDLEKGLERTLEAYRQRNWSGSSPTELSFAMRSA